MGKEVKCSFESAGGKDNFARIYVSMLQSPAFMDLSAKQRLLYIYMKAQFFGAGKDRPSNDFKDIKELQGQDVFYFPMSRAEQYKLYTRANHDKFYSDIKTLEEHGFIKTLSNGKASKQKSIYKFSGDWKRWKDTS